MGGQRAGVKTKEKKILIGEKEREIEREDTRRDGGGVDREKESKGERKSYKDPGEKRFKR